ncbi:MAG: UPF0280 family protein [Chloroflexi bacterium]|nr:UPF0280 family protein [Chloroflexota bacterium]
MIIQSRAYRRWVDCRDLAGYSVSVRETDLYVLTAGNFRHRTEKLVVKHRRALESYLESDPAFLTSLKPVAVPESAPLIVQSMAAAGARAGVGPMAAVAGAIAGFVGEELLAHTPEVIIENGGDIYLKSRKTRVIGIYAGGSPLTGKLGIEVAAGDTPAGVSTSSGTVGHSLSFGRADAAVVIAGSAALSDAVATALGNRVSEPADFAGAIEFARGIAGVRGVVLIMGEHLGVWGNVRLCRTALAGG